MPPPSLPSPQKSTSYHRMSNESQKDDTDRSSTTYYKEEEQDPFLSQRPFHPHRKPSRHIYIYPIVALLSLLLGALSSQFLRIEHTIDNYPAPYGHSSRLTSIVWNANASFADEPSERTDAAWSSLIPKGRGFVIHPKLAPADGGERKGKSVSVFHELHCLHGIRSAVFTTAYLMKKEKANNNAISSSPHDHPTMPAFVENAYIEASLKGDGAHHLEPHHLAHCFDYIRQALMCAADSNLEDVVTMDDENGVTLTGAEGWGSKRVCRDFWGLHEWSEKWRSEEGGGIS
ncbi:hypothetical protein CC86DRAFT_341428 [Ophiobolus disseminans]|uniref:Uncharacterized protein n=1 Tax=Ophiobolus disseminans TaxID=1469910 RepID=A0A6A7AI15_9PLEO|nr:hypothetical protein CC86DRAFT_341428 [Ophiobolus disseminans]